MRIASFNQAQFMVQNMLKTQTDLADTQIQLQTGKKYNNIDGFGAKSTTLQSTRSLLQRMDAHYQNNQQVQSRIDIYDSSLQSLEGVANELRDGIFNAMSLTDGTNLEAQLKGLVEQTANILNTKIEGRFIYGGTNTDTEPMRVKTADELLAEPEPPIGDFFDNSNVKITARLDDETPLEYGVLADEVGQQLVSSIQRILLFNDGTVPTGAGAFAPAGELNGQLSDNERQFLEAELDNVQSAIDTILAAEAENGMKAKTVELVQNRIQDEKVVLKEFLSEVEDADLGEASTRLLQQQASLQASMQLIGQIQQLSLINFL